MAAVALASAGCTSPSSDRDNGGDHAATGGITAQSQTIDPNAEGPAREIEGARKGGHIELQAEQTPITFDPTDAYALDTNAISRLFLRTPTQLDIRNGKPTLVPDLTDVGTVSDDKLTWTFKLQPGIRYEDGNEVKVEDLAYAIKRSFARDVYAYGPAYQLRYFKDGQTYKGPYRSGDTYSGVATQGTDTLIIRLAQPFADLPFYLTFPMFTPIPQAKDTKQEYRNHPLATGPYMFDTYRAGSKLVLKRNPNWQPETDPVRHQYPDTFTFTWGGDKLRSQTAALDSNGANANTINYEALDASLIPRLKGKEAQLLTGQSSCNYVFQMDSRKIPLEVRKAIAKAFPYDANFKAEGKNDYVAERASTVMPPSTPGYQKYPAVPDLTGTGPGDPEGARKMLEAAGKVGFEISYYYDNTKPIPQQVSQVRADALTKAGFKVKAIGVSTADLRAKTFDYTAPVNADQGPRGWCADWPSGISWFPVLFRSNSVTDGITWGALNDKEFDEKIDAVAGLPTEQATPKWAALDKEALEKYVALPLYYDKSAIVQGTNIGRSVIDPTSSLPVFTSMYLKS
ncbi:ABC transporter substrate-binding protein [Actinoplanes sp. TRM 88003]|uniref:ABC transporter substrate-binding protein n=1 Tax=Paractinoplanes aksuensis TaxID=2939490 RepID=A0ABT1DXH6_9ACTN|nr:ABC transporter substrate-binding protein [Actinoplanes aksuensis]MCO8275568.1 ABC transporter substrate-binding protein [Actinoplanes aksuensis]